MRRGVPEVEVYIKNGKRYLRESYGAFDIITELTPKGDRARLEAKDPDETFNILNEAISSLVKEERKKQKKREKNGE